MPALALDDLHGLVVGAPTVHAAVLGALLEEPTRIVRRLERELASLRPLPGAGGA
jgi:hypothetical protein